MPVTCGVILAEWFNVQSLCSGRYNMTVIITHFIAFLCDA